MKAVLNSLRRFVTDRSRGAGRALGRLQAVGLLL